MSNYTPTITYRTEFEGDSIVVVMHRMKKKHVLGMMSYMEREEDERGNSIMTVTDENLVPMMDKVTGWIAANIVSFNGLKDADGVEVRFDKVMEDQYFFELYQDIVNYLMRADSVGKVEEKNLEGQSEDAPVPALLQEQNG